MLLSPPPCGEKFSRLLAQKVDFYFSLTYLVNCRFPPKVSFSSFNDHANMKAEDKIILPRSVAFLTSFLNLKLEYKRDDINVNTTVQ